MSGTMLERPRRLAAAILAAVFVVSLLPQGVMGGPQAAVAQGVSSLTFRAGSVLNPQGATTDEVAIGDLTGDGTLDIILRNGSELSEVYHNNGRGGYRLAGALDAGTTSLFVHSVAVGDLTGDGALDIVVGNYMQSQVFRNDGAGRFTTSPAALNPGGDATASITVGDMTGDGHLDVILGASGLSQVYRNDGAGGFAPTSGPINPTRNDTSSVAVGDLNNDGDLDVVLGNMGQPSQVYLNDGTGVFTPTAAPLNPDGSTTSSVAVGDLNNDGDLDVVLGNMGQPSQVYLNDGTGVFTPTATPLNPGGSRTSSVAVGDLDGDGMIDLVLGNTGQPSQVYLNDGTGVFTPTATPLNPGGSRTSSVAVGDLDGDGTLDLVLGNTGQPSQVYFNDLRSTYAPTPTPLNASGSNTASVGVGDLNNDGTLDLVLGNTGQPSQVYLNNGSGVFTLSDISLNSAGSNTATVAVGDLDGNGKLDIVLGNAGQLSLAYLNEGGGRFRPAVLFNPQATTPRITAWEDPTGKGAPDVILGDLNGDGALDILLSKSGQPSRVYFNDGTGAFAPAATPLNPGGNFTTSAGVGDLNGDGTLDILLGNFGQASQVYFNDGTGTFTPAAAPLNPGGNDTYSVGVGDLNGDGALDILLGNTLGQASQVYFNDGTGTFTPAVTPLNPSGGNTISVALGDLDSDGTIDILLGNRGEPSQVYLNDGSGSFRPAVMPRNFTGYDTASVALGDLNGDGDLDILLGNQGQPSQILLKLTPPAGPLGLTQPSIRVGQPNDTIAAPFYATPEIFSQRLITIPFTLSDAQSNKVGKVIGAYSLDGGGSWRPARAANAAALEQLASSPEGVAHSFVWDVYANLDPREAVFGSSDNVVVRLTALPDLRPRSGGTAGPYQLGARSATSLPFRVRGTLPRVVSAANPGGERGALVYRMPAGQTRGAQPLPNRLSKQPLPSNAQGYVPSRNPVLPGDRLVAVLPVSRTGKLTYAYTSASPDATGLDMAPITAAAGVQTLTVTPANPLLLLNLDVGLEWDARGDPAYLDALKARLRRASEILYDWSDGQIALGSLTLYHNRERWEHTLDPQGAVIARGVDLRIYASNAIRPNATQGGIVDTPTTVTYPNAPGGARSATYEPGYIRIGAGWASAGEPGADSAEDWARALAHELGHYAFFLDETYLGRAGDLLVPVEGCPSPMADPYVESASEYRPKEDWPEACRTTLQYLGTGLSEWELIKQRYDRSAERDDFSFTLNAPTRAGANPGPAALPLAVTTFAEGDQGPLTGEASATYGIIPPDRGRYEAAPGARAILFRSGDGPPVDLGAPVGGQVQVRGMAATDRLCAFDPEQELLGCGLTATGLALVAKPGWRPELQITPLTRPGPTGTATMTLRVEVPATTVTTGTLPSALRLRLHPRESTLAPVNATLPLVDGVYRAEIALPEVVEEGLLQLWVDEPGQRREAVVDYSLGGNPAPKKKPPRRSRRNAPAVSPDGQATLFSEETSFGPGQFFALQSTSNLPAPPPWATVVGQGYRLMASDPAMLARPDRPLALSLGYAEGDVPPGLEGDVRVIFHDGSAWRELPTRVNTTRNEAAVVVQPTPGVYALVTSLRLRVGRAGWSMLYAYPGASQPLPEALIASARSYNAVYGYDPSDADDPWKLYSPLAPAWVNDLPGLENGASYWLHTTTPVTLSLRLPEPEASIQQAQDLLPPPPMTAYGILGPLWEVPVQAGLTVEALIDGEVCGSTTTRALGGGQVGFALDVLARGTPGVAGCGAPGVAVRLVFRDGPTEVGAIDIVWGHEAPAELRPTRVYLPAIQSGSAGAAMDSPGETDEGGD